MRRAVSDASIREEEPERDGTNRRPGTQWLVHRHASVTGIASEHNRDSIMKKKEALIESVNRLKASHEQAAGILQAIVHDVVRVSKGGSNLPERRDFRRYRRAIKELKLQCLQVEMILAEFGREE
ncbi:hypothetical protein [Herbaspirillum rubrisubalbicans]|nr:hypothetical protein [Herbaspirillum rubrisubalbicans]